MIPQQQLVFGLLACQAGYLTFEQLQTAIGHASETVDAATGSGTDVLDFEQLLCQQFHIDDQSRAKVHQMLAELQRAPADRDLETLASTAATYEGSLDVGVSTNDGHRFRVLAPLDGGAGGMGVIHIAEDSELGRQVALKQIRNERADREFDRQKFRLEAEITGNLEHPGIVPIYSLGTDDSGRPYYAMRLVSGEDFGQEIAGFHAQRAASTANFDSVEFRALIDRLIAVSQAVDYAHSRGVIHRDIKPSNVMVGRFGETLLIDWGLAKLPQSEDTADDTNPVEREAHDLLELRSGSHAPKTTQGSAMGTVGFAAPEQIKGELAGIGICSDVYSLGAVLYQILTNKTSVQLKGRNLQSVFDDIIAGRIANPHSVLKGVPKSLAAICMKALSTAPKDRYATARDFVNELERWKADQPVLARKESLLERAGRLARKHRSATVSATIALAFVALITTVALIEVNRQRKLASDSAIAEKNQRLLAEAAQLAAEQAAEAEREAKQQATKLANRNQKVVDAFVAAFQIPNVTDFAGPSDINSAELTATQVLEQALLNLDSEESLQDDDASKASLLYAVGTSLRSVSKLEQAEQALQRSLDLHTSQYGPLARDTCLVQLELAYVKSQQGDNEAGLELVRKVANHALEEWGEEDSLTFTAQGYVANILRESGDLDGAMQLYQQLVPKMRRVLGERDPDVLVVSSAQGLCLVLAGRLNEAIPLLEATVPLHREVYGRQHPKTVLAMLALASAYSQSTRINEALPIYSEAAELMESRLGAEHPSTLMANANLATAYFFLGQYNQVLPVLEPAYLALKEHLGDEHPQVLTLMNNLAMTYQGLRQNDKALKLFQENYDIRSRVLGESHVDTLGSEITLGLGYLMQGQYEKALEFLEHSEQMLIEHHGDAHPFLIQAIGLQANAHQSLGRIDRAIEIQTESLALSTKLYGPNAPNTFAAIEALASNLRLAGRLTEAKEKIVELVARQTELMGADNIGALTASLELAAIELELKNPQAALDLARNAWEILRDRDEATSAVAIKARFYLAASAHRVKDYALSAEHYEGTLATLPEAYGPNNEMTVGARVGLGFALCGLDRDAEALAQFQQAADAEGPIAETLIFARALDGWQSLLLKSGEFAAARPIIERWNNHPFVQQGTDANMTARAQLSLCEVLLELGQYEEAVLASDELPKRLADDELSLAICESMLGMLVFQRQQQREDPEDNDATLEKAGWDKAESHLVDAADTLFRQGAELEPYRRWHAKRVLERLIQFYEATGQNDKTAGWHEKLNTFAP